MGLLELGKRSASRLTQNVQTYPLKETLGKLLWEAVMPSTNPPLPSTAFVGFASGLDIHRAVLEWVSPARTSRNWIGWRSKTEAYNSWFSRFLSSKWSWCVRSFWQQTDKETEPHIFGLDQSLCHLSWRWDCWDTFPQGGEHPVCLDTAIFFNYTSISAFTECRIHMLSFSLWGIFFIWITITSLIRWFSWEGLR